jgi:hypothetical protein
MSGDPASLIISVISPTEIDLSWTDNVTNEQGYKIERSVNDDSHYSVIDSIPANSNTYTGTSLNPSTLYYYRVRAYKGSSTYSNYTNSVSGTTYVIPIAPSGLTGIPSTTEATVDNFTFTNNSPNCEGIRVYISPDGEEWFEFIDISPLSGDATGFSLTNLFPPDFSLGYRYVKISAFSGTLESGYSNIVEGSQYDAINTIGTDTGDFTTLYDAIDFINEGNAIGNILYKVIENTIETESVILYESGYEGLSSYASVIIYPTISGLTISGNIAGDLIRFDHTDNVNIDGRVNQAGAADLHITNSHSGSPVAVHIIGATNSDVINCILTGSKIIE